MTVTLDTTFDQLCRWVSSDERGKNVDPGNMKLCYNSLMEKAENKEKEQEREEARRVFSFMSFFSGFIYFYMKYLFLLSSFFDTI